VSTWPSWETARLAWEGIRFWLIISIGSMLGLLGAYGREQHEGRAPNRKWLIDRLCVMPFLASAAAALTDTLNLSGQVALFVASIFSLLAYDLVRVIAMRTLNKAAGGEVKLPTDAAVEILPSPGKPDVIKVKVTPGVPMRGVLREAYPAKPEHDTDMDRLLGEMPERWGDPEV
jgi:hypothetical protein